MNRVVWSGKMFLKCLMVYKEIKFIGVIIY